MNKLNDYKIELLHSLILGDHIDIDTLLEHMAQNEWPEEMVIKFVGEDFLGQYKAIVEKR
tara:strand:+ start:37 stop:216 length:180 start_codon:yes stop_codon:yes gene_type:complete